ncbi:hypothetical protein PFICI_13330 [Pestalotiopsis fici W106-1]|uniref:Uncharacterized protein n=1 Tax=Pestalotiopsis fici (strain W106-1 / CGMCC3.15140) TaxID=1229662 RepID=W3WPV4_PESFW|nr:uncharacterized protein PFICI_13330 [Pestalotiopsis fici W106-1]ETS74846.1 hypothetical protein PFICI_13330 [Pestalotiopsis fici W106-1]
MPNNVALQADIGSLGLSGLGAFTTLLSAMSKDNVQPMAMMLLENLGSLFHVNGPYASHVPEVMTRAVSHPVGRLSLAVGWRRGDAISVFAQTAGGQAITLLATCLANIYEEHRYGLILSNLCTLLLPKSLPRSSPTQVADIAKLVAAKAAPLSFGNVLAQQTHRVLSVYQQLQLKPPTQLLEPPSVESAVQLFENLTYLQNGKDCLVRVSGSTSILYIIAMVLFMFPSCTMVTVESMVIHDNEEARIIIEVSEALTKVQVETKLDPCQTLVATPITPLRRRYHETPLQPSLQWDGWLKQALCLQLARFGLIFTHDLQETFCEFMVQIAPHLKLCDFRNTGRRFSGHPMLGSRKRFDELLGPHFRYKLASTCREICLYDPQQKIQDPVAQWQQLIKVLERGFKSVKCTCGQCVTPFFRWPRCQRECSRQSISRIMGSALAAGILCCLLEPQGPVNMTLDDFSNTLSGPVILRVLGTLGLEGADLTEPPDFHGSQYGVYRDILSLIDSRSSYNDSQLGLSCGGYSIYPRVLDSFGVDSEGRFTFKISEGLFLHNDTYHHFLCEEDERPKFDLIAKPGKELAPLSIAKLGEPLSLTVSLREGFGGLAIRLNVQRSGLYFNVSPVDTVLGLMYLDTTQSCDHGIGETLHEEYEAQVAIGSIGTVPNKEFELNITTTAGNSQAQFLACNGDGRGDLLLKCCLNCGVRQALEGGYTNLIVT